MQKWLGKSFMLLSAAAFVSVAMFAFAPDLTRAYSLCDEMSKETNGFLSCGQESTTFTDFQGGLTPPDSSGYAPGLTQATNARDYIKNVVNFALSFLGLIAVLVVIYGGFLYVTARGQEDQTEKGKKSITYAVIGLIIIMGSFAIVNTILQAPSGTDKNLNGAAPGVSGDQNEQRRAFFNYAAIAVQSLARDFVSAYQNYTEINADIVTLQNTSLEQEVKDPQNLKQILQNKKNILVNMATKAGTLSQVAERTQAAILIYNKYLSLTDKAMDMAASDSQAANAENTGGDDGANKFEQFWTGTNYGDYMHDINVALAGEGGTSLGIKLANSQDFAQAVIRAHEKIEELYDQMKQAAQSPEINAAFLNILQQFKALLANWQDPTPTQQAYKSWNLLALFIDTALAQSGSLPSVIESKATNATVLKLVNDMSKLYDLVKEVQFIYAVITADVVEGNAPLVVNFDALKSLDPNNRTIPDANFSWDFGDGATAVGVASSHTYDKPGAYVVKLVVKAPEAQANEKKPADGIVYRTITVKPPSSRIDLRVGIGGKNFQLSQYDTTGFQTRSLQNLNVTTEEAKAGLNFDATKTATGGGKLFTELTKGGPAKVKWDFGDKSNAQNTLEGPPDTVSLLQKINYKSEGSYRVTLEVTDDRGMTDRKIFNVLVSSLAARVDINPGNEGKLGDQFTFDGSASASDSGQIKNFEWKILKNALNGPNQDLTPLNAKNADLLKFAFKESGDYQVQLTVNDGSKDDTASVPVKIISKPPVAQFEAINSKTKPNIYLLDASTSYDPDSEVELKYKWEINAAPGNCIFLDGNLEQDCSVLKKFQAGPKYMKPKIRLNKGEYTIRLDLQNPEEPERSVPQEKTINVENDLDVGWGDDGKPLTAKLKDGLAAVTFSINSENGLTYLLETGDGAQEEGSLNVGAPTLVSHTYSETGTFNAKLTVFDGENNENSTVRKVFVAAGDAPLAAITVSVDGELVNDTSEPIEASRKTVFSFDASKSLSSSGGTNLVYSWDLGDGTRSTRRQFNHTFKELTPKDQPYYTVRLKVSDVSNPAKASQIDEIKIKILSLPPLVRGLTVVPAGENLTTPVSVNLSASGAEDPDGKVVSYRWWYYDLQNPEEQRGLQITQAPSTTIILGTNGEENEKRTYGFAVLVTDNDNQTYNTFEKMSEDRVPTLEVTNGPNKAPVAKFSVERTTVDVGQPVNFASTSVDPDANGSIVKYIWDFEGNGFADDLLNPQYNKANVAYIYKRPYRDGVRVRLKVVDINGAEAVSDAVPIYVEGASKPPVAAFPLPTQQGKVMKFTNNSRADEATGAKLVKFIWDFDLNLDSDGDGLRDNDVDSTEKEPSHEYPNYGVYRAKLSVEDDQGGKAFVFNFVNVKAPVVTPAAPATTEKLEARLTSSPAPSTSDGRIHLQGDSAPVIFNFSDSRGAIQTYILDKNIYFDANGNGIKDDDEDYKTSTPGTWTTQFAKKDGLTRVRLTVVDASGKKSFVEKDIVFDAAPSGTTNTNMVKQLGANVLGDQQNPGPALLVTLLGFAILLHSRRVLKKLQNPKDETKY